LSRHLLTRFAGPVLDELLVQMVVEDLRGRPDEECDSLRASLRQQQGNIIVTSAHPLSETSSQALQRALDGISNQAVTPDYQLDPALVSGVRISIGSHVLHANLADELAFFQRGLNHDNR